MDTILPYILIPFFLFWVISWNLPEVSFLNRIAKAFSFIPLWLGLSQSWQLFSPNPRRQNAILIASIIYDDGSEYQWGDSSFQGISHFKAFCELRKRRWMLNLMSEKTPFLKRSFAEYLAHNLSHPNNPVAVVLLRRISSPIALSSPTAFIGTTSEIIFRWHRDNANSQLNV
jgi:hypothetical protein